MSIRDFYHSRRRLVGPVRKITGNPVARRRRRSVRLRRGPSQRAPGNERATSFPCALITRRETPETSATSVRAGDDGPRRTRGEIRARKRPLRYT